MNYDVLTLRFCLLCCSPVKAALHEHWIPFAGGLALYPGGVIATGVLGGIVAAAVLLTLLSYLAKLSKLLLKRNASFTIKRTFGRV